MGVSVMYDDDRDRAALFCNTTDHAFGPAFFVDGRLEVDALREWVRETDDLRYRHHHTTEDLRAAFRDWKLHHPRHGDRVLYPHPAKRNYDNGPWRGLTRWQKGKAPVGLPGGD